jgi:hydroxyacylglutathione hydrolase
VVKRVLRALGLLVLVLVLAVVLVGVVTFGGMPDIPDGRDLGGGTRVIKDGFVSLFVLDAGDGAVALVDAGNDPDGEAILSELGRRGLGPDAVKAIFLTHGHADHVAAVRLFPGAQVMALAEDVDLAEGRARGKGPLPKMVPAPKRNVRVSKTLKDNETVHVGTLTVKVLAIPGHTGGSAAYLARGTLFLGDSADAQKDGRVDAAKWLFSDDAQQNRASLKALAARLAPRASEIKTLAFSHSGVLVGFEPLAEFAALK